ncbi:MAG: GMP synthase subunit A [Candidatus Thermoplasmatota archaeon]
MKVYVVDNGGQWTHREWRVLRDLGVDSIIIPNTTSAEFIEKEGIDALVLSGGSPRIGKEKMKLGRTAEYFDLKLPIFGICVAHQYIAVHYGGSAGKAKIPEYGKTLCYIDKENIIFKGLPKKFYVWESHNDEVKKVPKGFEVLAHSDNCMVQALCSKNRKIYSVQFHPEVEHTEYGLEIFKNFLSIVKEA